MKIVETYSHLNGLEYLLVHKKQQWDEIRRVIDGVDAAACRTKVSKEKTMKGRKLYSPVEMNRRFAKLLNARKWQQSRVSYWVTRDQRLIRKTLGMSAANQKTEIKNAGFEPILSYNQTDFVKERIAIEVQFGKYSFVAYDLFVKHLAFYVGDEIVLGLRFFQ